MSPYWLIAALPAATLAISPVFRTKFADTPKIIALHSLNPVGFDLSALSIERFIELINMAKSIELRFGTIEDAISDPRIVALTFDDGYDDLYRIVPLIQSEEIPITVFVPTKFVGKTNTWDSFFVSGKRRHLNGEQIGELSKLGVRFGSHSHNHGCLSGRNEKTIEYELSKSKNILESLTGKPVDTIAYPFGVFDRTTEEVALRLGYRIGLTSRPKRKVGFTVGRIPVNRLDTSFTLQSKLSPGLVSGAEYLKCSIINRFSHLTPIYQRLFVRTQSQL